MDLKRREFFGAGAAGLGTLIANPLAFGDDKKPDITRKPKKTFSADPLALIPLTEKIKTTRIGFGTGMRGWKRESNLVRMDRKKAVGLLQFAYDKGIRLFDLADLYGTHPIFAEALGDKKRDEITIATKIWLTPNGLPEDDRPDADIVVKRFLKELKTDYIDLVQLHCMTNDRWVDEFGKQMEIMEKLKEQGLIRAHGCSAHANTALELAAKNPWTDVVHVRINSEGVNMDGPVDGVKTVMQKVHDAGIGTIAMKVIGEGKFADSLELRKKSVAFVTALECIDVMVVGFDEKEHITELIDNVAEALKTAKA